jgi:hypothetical protein
MRESVATHDVAVSASRDDVVACVPSRVIYAVAPDLLSSSAVDARLREHAEHEFFVDVADTPALSVYLLVRLHEKNGAAFRRSPVATLALKAFGALFWRQLRPSFFSAVAALTSLAVTRFAFVAKARWSRLVSQEVRGQQRKHHAAAMALALLGRVVRVGFHAPIIADGPHSKVYAA